MKAKLIVLLVMIVNVNVEGKGETVRLLKQSADQLLLGSMNVGSEHRSVQDQPYSSQVSTPSHVDLQVRRLQLRLLAQVEDNWKAITEPQRFVILKEKGALVQILRSFLNLVKEMDLLENNIKTSEIEHQLNGLRIDTEEIVKTWYTHWDKLRNYVNQIGQLYSYFDNFVRDPENVSEDKIGEFVSALVRSRFSESQITNMLTQFHHTVAHTHRNYTLFSLIHTIYQQNDEHLCSMTQSPFQLMYNLYNMIALTELKGYAMLQFAYMTLRINNEGNFTLENEAARQNFEIQSKEKLGSVMEVLPEMSRGYWRCDPRQHKEDTTYIEIKGFMQGYIENEVDMNDLGSCKAKCSEYTYAEPKGCYKDMFCSQQPRCTGRIFDCEFYNADAWVCMSANADRRYDWVEYEDGTVLGRNTDQCINKIKVDSWWRWIFWHCSYCFCKCDEITDRSERYWSLVPAEADAGYLVTGVRFIKRNKVIHLQIQQAKPTLEGGVLEESKEWKEPEVISASNLTQSSLVYTMSYEQRAVDLDSLSAPEGYVMTGLKLRNIGGHLNLEIKVNPIMFRTGEILTDQYLWIGNDNTPASGQPRKLLPLIMPDVPTRLAGSNKVDGSHDMYLNFDTSSALKDVGQTTVPFVEAQPVSMQPSTWLSGAGLYHKGRIGFGGFVGLSVETYDFSRHMSVNTPQLEQLVKLDFVKAEGA